MRQLARRCAFVLVALGLALSACTKLPEDYPTPTPIPTPSTSNKPVYTVQRGTIDQVVKALGRVAANQENIMYFRQDGRLYHLYVQTDQKVKQGDLLAELDTGTLKNQVQIAKVNAEIAQLKVDQAMGKDVTGGSGPTAAVLQAQANVAKAEADYAKAQDTLNILLQGPTDADIASAKASIQSAQSTLASAQSSLTDLQAKPKAEDITIAQQAIDQAKNNLYAAQLRRDSTCGSSGSDSGDCKSANATVASSETAVQTAQTNLQKAQEKATPDQIKSAQQAVQSAQAGVASAQASYDKLFKGPTQDNVDSAKQGVASAKATLDAARVALTQAQGTASGKSIDVQIAQKQADLSNLQLAELQDQLNQAQLRAPFDGVVTETDAKDGDQVQSYTPILTVSNPAKLEIAVELQASDLANVALGQPASIVLSAYPATTLQGKVIRMPTIQSGNGPELPATLRTVRISFPNPPGVVNLGDLANVAVDVQKKEGVLVLPTTAIRTFGGRRFVRVETADGRYREVDIEVGISDDTNTEITKGVQAGDKVISP
ncbi:MAG TPA: efflux RND transporter periplasmic adaptor subunit [Chloroflexota bacterium]|nr:efflux RND transporter periplasmic adaptor subunit [Chloroflexota bacterium]